MVEPHGCAQELTWIRGPNSEEGQSTQRPISTRTVATLPRTADPIDSILAWVLPFEHAYLLAQGNKLKPEIMSRAEEAGETTKRNSRKLRSIRKVEHCWSSRLENPAAK